MAFLTRLSCFIVVTIANVIGDGAASSLPLCSQTTSPPSVTVAVLSCRRLDLLERTIESFERMNTYPVAERLILDCDNSTTAVELAQQFAPYQHVPAATFDNREHNIMLNMQALFQRAKSKYMYFSEDDWGTVASGFLDHAIAVLESPAGENVSQLVAARHAGGCLKMDHRKHKRGRCAGTGQLDTPDDIARGLQHGTTATCNNFTWVYIRPRSGGGKIYGAWTNNPGVVEMSVYQTLIGNLGRFTSEREVNRAFYNNSGVRTGARMTNNTFVHHLGGTRHVKSDETVFTSTHASSSHLNDSRAAMCGHPSNSRRNPPASCADGFIRLLPQRCTWKWHRNCEYSNPKMVPHWASARDNTGRPLPTWIDVVGAPANRPQPLVSAFTPFFSHDSEWRRKRRPYLAAAVAQWHAQRYQQLEYVILYADTDLETAALVARLARKFNSTNRRIVPVVVDATASHNVGRLRNQAIEVARGQYVAVWDEDDLHHPLRIAASVITLQCSGKLAVMLDGFMYHFTESGQKRSFLSAPPFPQAGTLLAAKQIMTNCYTDKWGGEDSQCRMKLIKKGDLVMAHAPWLYGFVKHGKQTTSEEAFARYQETSKDGERVHDLPPAVHTQLAAIARQSKELGMDSTFALRADHLNWPTHRDVEKKCWTQHT